MTGLFPLSRPVRVHPSCALVLAAVCWCLAPSSVRACRVELAGDESAAWRDALAGLSLAADACDTLRVEVTSGQARLILTTREGRQAVRTLAEPGELAPAIDALLVTDALVSSADAASAPATAASAAPVTEARQEATRKHDLAGLVALLGGARAGGDVYISPLLNLEGHLRIDRWEVGAQLGWVIDRYDLNDGDPLFGDWMALLPALSFAHRRPLTRAMLLSGARFGLGLGVQDTLGRSGSSALDFGALGVVNPFPALFRNEAWTGFLFGVVFPPHARVRMRAELTADWIFLRWDRGFRSARPDWSIGLSIGVEYGRS